MRRSALFVTLASAGAVLITVAVAAVAIGVPSGFGAGPGAAQPTGDGSDAATTHPGSSSSSSSSSSSDDRTPGARAAEFFRDWVHDGRVIRHDQGGDTVSEGQAYGLLIAAGTRNADEFSAIWSWTEQHLQRPDGLLAWRWQNGAVVDDEPASDADVDTARALLVAGEAMHHPSWTAAGKRLATQIIGRMTATTALGRILLPGEWAAGTQPYAYNPSYASPAAFAVIARLTKDSRWTELEAGSRAVTRAILDTSTLPPDWAQVHEDGTVDDMPGARGSGQSVRYGYDAERLPIRYAESCSAQDRALAGRLAPTLERTSPLVAELDLGGGPLTGDRHPLAYLARAASAAAEAQPSGQASPGSRSGTGSDLRAADTRQAKDPTYYGAAWTTLSSLLLTTSALGGCPPLSPGGTPSAPSASGGSR